MIKLVASDLDGTILDKNNSIFANNFKAFEDLRKHNMNFVVCTGKTYHITKKMCSAINASFGIFGNGNLVMDLRNNNVLYKKLLNTNEVLACIDIAKKHNMHVHIYSSEDVITEKLEYLDLRNYKLQQVDNLEGSLNFKIVDDIKDYVIKNNPEVFKLVISDAYSTASARKDIQSSFDLSVATIRKMGEYKDAIINKEYEYLDVTSKNTSKQAALEFLGNYLNIKPDEMLTIGDNVNDYDMIQKAGIGVAVANAYDELKQIANYTTVNPVEKGGFAEAIYKFIEF